MNKEYLDLLEIQARADLQIAMAKASMTPIQMIIKKHPEIKGYTLLQEYPGCNRKVGDFEPYTSYYNRFNLAIFCGFTSYL